MDKYEEFDIQITTGGIMGVEPMYENEETLRFSDEGNNSPRQGKRFGYGEQGKFMKYRDNSHHYDEYADGFGTTLDQGTNDYDPMSNIGHIKDMPPHNIMNYNIEENPDQSDPTVRRPYNPPGYGPRRTNQQHQPHYQGQNVPYARPQKHHHYQGKPIQPNYDDILGDDIDMREDTLDLDTR